jgi:hypothetical protein
MSHGGFAKRNGKGMPQQQQQMPQFVQVQIPDVNACASYHCPACMNNIFTQGFRVIEVSALLHPTGIAQPGQIPMLICSNCHLTWEQAMLKKLSPKERDELVEMMKQKQAGMEGRRG